MKLKHYFLGILFLGFTWGTSAQNNYRHGYIITNDNDTVYGWIDFRTDQQNFLRCSFKSSLDEVSVQTYLPSQIAGYRFIEEGKFYVSRTIHLENVTFNQVFLEFLLQGNKNLYYYNDEKSLVEYYLFEDESGNMIPISKKPDELLAVLGDRERFSHMDKATYVTIQDNKYKGVLTYLFKEQPELKKDIEQLPFRRAEMVELAKSYHDLTCEPGTECIIFENDYKRRFAEVDFSLYGGVQYAMFSTRQVKVGFETVYPVNSYFPVIGGQINLFAPRWTRFVGLQMDLSLTGLSGTNDMTQEFKTYWHHEKYSMRTLMFDGKLGVKFQYPKGRVRPTLEAGGNFVAFFDRFTTSEITTTNKISGSVKTRTEDNKIPMETTYFGWHCAAGLNFMLNESSFILFRVSYEDNYGYGFSYDINGAERTDYYDRIRMLQLKVGYSF